MRTNPATEQNKDVKWSESWWNQYARCGKGLWWKRFGKQLRHELRIRDWKSIRRWQAHLLVTSMINVHKCYDITFVADKTHCMHLCLFMSLWLDDLSAVSLTLSTNWWTRTGKKIWKKDVIMEPSSLSPSPSSPSLRLSVRVGVYVQPKTDSNLTQVQVWMQVLQDDTRGGPKNGAIFEVYHSCMWWHTACHMTKCLVL